MIFYKRWKELITTYFFTKLDLHFLEFSSLAYNVNSHEIYVPFFDQG